MLRRWAGVPTDVCVLDAALKQHKLLGVFKTRNGEMILKIIAKLS